MALGLSSNGGAALTAGAYRVDTSSAKRLACYTQGGGCIQRENDGGHRSTVEMGKCNGLAGGRGGGGAVRRKIAPYRPARLQATYTVGMEM